MSRLKNTPLVSVIMPVFNGEKYIAQAIDSILQQTYKKLELIIIDDASTDNTNDIINTIKDKRIKYIKNNKNSKEWYSRNVGLAKAKGDYIAWQDADDMADKKRIDKQLLWLKQHKHHQMVGSDMAIINQYGKWLKTIPATAMNMAWHRQRIFCPTTMFDKKILSAIPQPFFRPGVIGEDIDFL
ncbi:MAG: glycosyltransferase family 2 protein, partial [Alphaproteobacteria bacterium]